MKCQKTNCTNDATCEPILRIWAKGYPKEKTPPIEMHLGLKICDDHKGEFTPDIFSVGDNWNRVRAAMNSVGKADPDPASTEVYFKGLIKGFK